MDSKSESRFSRLILLGPPTVPNAFREKVEITRKVGELCGISTIFILVQCFTPSLQCDTIQNDETIADEGKRKGGGGLCCGGRWGQPGNGGGATLVIKVGRVSLVR